MSLTFAHPWLLLALLLLPPLWWLIRRLPPSPRPVRFPGVRLLLGLASRARRPASAPLWLRLLRLAAVLLAIVGLAEPRLAAAPRTGGSGPLLLLIDGGWASARDWERRVGLAGDLLAAAGRSRAPARVAVLAESPPAVFAPAPASAWQGGLAALSPAPWPPDRDAWADLVAQAVADGSTVHWIHDGLAHDGGEQLLRALEGADVTIHRARGLLRALAEPVRVGGGASIGVLRASSSAPEDLAVQARDRDGRLIARGETRLETGERAGAVRFEIASPLANRIASFHIDGEGTAAATRLVGNAWQRPRVGILSAGRTEQPLLDGAHYVRAALAPFAETVSGDIDALLARAPHSIATLDALPARAALRLDAWVRGGGQLVRFAGPDMAAQDAADPLLPVRILSGGRNLGGAMSWNRPQAIASFNAEGPFAGLSTSSEARVARQLLAAPDEQTRSRTWARLEDGTPIITAAALGEGEIALVHTTADTRWSTLPLTGDFARLLERIIRRANGSGGGGEGPWRMEVAVTAYGALRDPAAASPAVPAERFSEDRASAGLPPGLYSSNSSARAVSVETDLETLPAPAGARLLPLAVADAIAPAPWILALAILLVAVDAAVSAHRRPAAGTAATLLAVLAALPFEAPAQEAPAGALETTFAYVLTGDERLDRRSKAGLNGLGHQLRLRTSVAAAPPIGVDPAVDDLSLFPILYWPIRGAQPAPSDAAVAELNRFLATGGMMILDTGDQGVGATGAGPGRRDLVRLVGRLNLPPLAVAGSGHILTRSFYLINDFPGRWSGGRIWVAAPRGGGDGSVNDDVTPVILGGSDWASAWAVDSAGRPLAALDGGSGRQREMAVRAGVNFAMHALTGNYKHDQVHQKAILERLQN